MDDQRKQDLDDGNLPSDDEEIAKEGERNREELDEIPAPGTDPLHEGP